MSEKAQKPKRPFQTHFTGLSKTKKQYGQYVGAKNIIKNNGYQQHITSLNINSDHPVAQWDDSTSLHHQLNVVKQLDRRFNDLSREARKHYGTSENMIKELEDQKNWQKAVELGVLPQDILSQIVEEQPETEQKKQPEPVPPGQAADKTT